MSKLVIVGTVAFDAIETPFGKTDKILGGAATYIGLSASNFQLDAAAVSVVGGDFPQEYLDLLKDRNINIGFSSIHRDWLKKEYKKYVKGKCKIEKFLKFKYILSVEGNDKDSGLNWKLNSNSLVLMPKPRVTSWLMETTLIPNFHYVLLKDDFSNLKKMLNWCNSNQKKCKKIISNANNFMKQFSNNEMEEKLEEVVINKYFEILGQ